MSSIPSSPTKRKALSSKSFNIKSSPFNSTKKPIILSKLSPSKSQSSSASPVRKQPKLTFSIWEDQPNQEDRTETIEDDEEPISNKQNNHDQENILQPKKHEISRFQAIRKPLAPLSINEFPGFVSFANSSIPRQLTQLYHPPNFNNEFKSLHKKSNLPSFVTPSRRNRDKYLVVSNRKSLDECPFDEDEDNDIDETELYLIKKQQQRLSSTVRNNIIRKHTRSLSVGKNESKLSLIRKNNFTIVSN
ncbi:uncharacterized protein J8A68_004699 [[Candida] subhashii]|uniref:Uncharacterized protein n=1 Tax=[Candida] subhashii TaxID=561895 RepID=A0A8J5QIG9_9ASCO|nr:uncharacterized protein J8A68_004699 [[Candida] subhashii]KAG7661751.1 hypothetical protein J8A68_004699 [[Candida] subhashii]